MPLYDYKCSACGKTFEIRHGFNERHERPCEACGGARARVYNPAPIVFKGSGLYVTDSRMGGGSKPAAKAEAAASEPTSAGAPKPDTPKADAPKADAPKADASKAENSAA